MAQSYYGDLFAGKFFLSKNRLSNVYLINLSAGTIYQYNRFIDHLAMISDLIDC